MRAGRIIRFILLPVCCLCCAGLLQGQEKQRLSSTTEQQLENEAVADNGVIKDDAYLQQLDYYSRHPLRINEAGAAELEALRLLTPLQIEELLNYRRLLGKLINIYELQSVPGWDIVTIRRLLPYIVVSDEKNLPETLKGAWKGGEHSFTLNSSRVLEKAKGFDVPDSGKSAYLGSRDNVFFRYKYNYKNILQWGLLGAKDAGESYFDFYSFHLFAKGPGCVKTLALGDFTVNMGQGLLQWQTLAFKKSADVLAIKRQSPVLRPYNSTGEYNFHRGIGLTLQRINGKPPSSHPGSGSTAAPSPIHSTTTIIFLLSEPAATIAPRRKGPPKGWCGSRCWEPISVTTAATHPWAYMR